LSIVQIYGWYLMSYLSLQNLVVTYPGMVCPAVNRINLELEAGEISCLLGASGCGKTTVLRAIAGFVSPHSGRIDLAGRCIANFDEHGTKGTRINLPPEKRQVGMVFQDFALFPHLTVAGNIVFGLAQHPRTQSAERVMQLLELVGLQTEAQRYPHELSGGQQQRVALARALAPQPALLLLDEPFSSLDAALRERLSQELRRILKTCRTTAIVVTHDQQEAFSISDKVGVMRDGQIEQWDTAYNLYHRPVTRYVANFIGEGAFVPGHLRGVAASAYVDTEVGSIQPEAVATAIGLPHGTSSFDVLLRPDDVVHDDAAPLQALVLRKAFRGADFLYTLKLPSGREVLALVPSHHNHNVGEMIGIRLDADHLVAFTATV
jgi:iron(III) transport system ATP-binding protein